MQKPFAITLDPGSSLANKTGSWRTERPVYVDRPAAVQRQVPRRRGHPGLAVPRRERQLRGRVAPPDARQPVPGDHGTRLLSQLRRRLQPRQHRHAVGINSVERFLGDEALKRGWRFESPRDETGKARADRRRPDLRACRPPYQLRRLGHAVTVLEAGPAAGRDDAIRHPKYRLPRDVLDAEMQRIVEMGVTVRLGAKVDNIARTMTDGGFAAAFLAVGAHIAKRAFIPAKDSARILDAVAVLRSMEGEEPPMLGRRVVVYGGGNTAIDVARTAKRLGATERSSSTGARARRCRRTTSRSRRRSRKA
jgi:NADPH-dependent glutamate synthase beta subunit-like oxidoreductase